MYEQGDCTTNHAMPAMMSLAVGLPGAIVAPHVLAVAIDYQGTTLTPTVTDSLGNVFQPVSGPARSPTQSSRLFFAPIAVAGNDVVTVTFDGLADGIGLYVHEYSGLSVTAPLDTFVVGIGNGTAMSSGNATTAAPDELLFAHGTTDNVVMSPGAGFSARQTCNGNMTEDGPAATPGAYAATFTASSPANWIASMATFRPQGCP
jgi:hypothetical protein